MASPQTQNGYTKIANELFEVVVRTPLPSRHKDLWFWVLRKTYGFGKKKDYISLSQFVIGTRIDRSSVCRILKDLVAWHLLVKDKSVYGVNKDYSSWLVAQRPLAGSGVQDNLLVAYTPHTKETIQKKKEKGDFISLKSMKKNKVGVYNEIESSDSFEDVLNSDSNEIEIKEKKKPRNKQALALQTRFLELAEEETGVRPIQDTAGYVRVLEALKIIKEEDILEMFLDWFGKRQNPHVMSLKACLSNNQINEYRKSHE